MNDSARRCAHPGSKVKTPWGFVETLILGVILVERRWKRHAGNVGCSGYADA